MLKRQLGINSVSTRHSDLEEACHAYSQAGFGLVEFVIPQVKQYLAGGRSTDSLASLLNSCGLTCIGGFEEVVKVFAEPEQLAANLVLHRENAKLLADLGAQRMVVGTDGSAVMQDDVLGVLANRFAEVAEAVQPTGVTLCIEFNWSPVVKSLRTAAEVARRSGAPNVGIVFDPAHYHCTPTKCDQLNEANAPYIRHVHLNNMADKPGELSDCNSDRVLPGQGCLDLAALIARIEALGYGGNFSIEMFSQELWALSPTQSSRLMYQSLLPFCSDGASP